MKLIRILLLTALAGAALPPRATATSGSASSSAGSCWSF
jgi:hypothetical protein